MKISNSVLTALAGSALGLAAAAQAVPIPFPTYTFCEEEGNDTCPDAQVLDASEAAAAVGGGPDGEFVRDCFYITGKLQEDCVWDIEPKCAINVYDKRKPCRDEDGDLIPNQFYEPILAMSTGGDLVVPASQYPDRVLRLGIAALFDKVDGTINGLAGNGAHHEIGEVTVKIFYGGGGGDGRGDEPDQSYVFTFGGTGRKSITPIGDAQPDVREGGPSKVSDIEVTGTDAVRAAFVIPPGVASVRVVCCDDTGTIPLCWDVDFYEIRNLIPGAFYGVEQIGGLTDVTDVDDQDDCVPTNTKLGWFDKQCFLVSKDDNSGRDPTPGGNIEYPRLYASADENGTLRIGVSGARFFDGPPSLDVQGGPIPDGVTNGPPGTLQTSRVVLPGPIVDGVRIDRILSFALAGFVHTWVGDLKVVLRHVETGTTAVIFDRPGVPQSTFGFSNDLNGLYAFADVPPVPGPLRNFEATAMSTNPVTPGGFYAPHTPLSAFEGELLAGTWTLTVTDHVGGDTGRLGSWSLLFRASAPGDCDFDGLRDDRQDDYRDLLEEINLFTGSDYVYTPGASTKDDSVDGVNRYPRSIWDPFHPSTNPDGFGFLEWFGGPPERFAAHGVCGGYCLKVQLAEHIGTRPNFPTVMTGGRVDLNQDGVINATDLALLLSYWGVVQ